MVNGLQGLVSGEQIAAWLVIAFLVAYFIYKELPEFRKRVSNRAVKEKDAEYSEKTIIERLEAIEKKLKEMDDKLVRDYDRINNMEKEQKEFKKMQRNSLKERELIMKALLAMMKGMPDNEDVLQSEKEIDAYLLEQSHQNTLS